MYDVAIVGSGLTGATFARVIADAVPDVQVIVLEVGPRLTPRVGQHLRAVPEDVRSELLIRSQGYDRTVHQTSSTYLRTERGPDSPASENLERPGLFLLAQESDRPTLLPSIAMASAVGGMGILWRGSCPRPFDSEMPSMISAAAFDALLTRAYRLLEIDMKGVGSEEPVGVELGRALNLAYKKSEWPNDRPVRPLPLAVSGGAESQWLGTNVILQPAANAAGDRLTIRDGMALHSHTPGPRWIRTRGAGQKHG